MHASLNLVKFFLLLSKKFHKVNLIRANFKNNKMRRLVCLLLIYQLTFFVQALIEDDSAEINPAGCGQLASAAHLNKKRYLDGVVSVEGARPWHVAIIDEMGEVSSGSLINSQWVLTSAVRYL
jgi:hypothetical protein